MLTTDTMEEESTLYKDEKVYYNYQYQDIAHSVVDRDLETETRLYKLHYGNYVHAFIDEILRLNEDPDFIRDDTYNGVYSDHHIMFKLRCDERGSTRLISRDGNRGYEFLVEFDLKDTSYGIYYGCRGLILGGDQEDQINRLLGEWKSLSPEIRTVLNNTFENIDFIEERFQPTNNANNRTFWPFWITLYKGEDILKVAARATKLIFRVYRDFIISGRPAELPSREKKSADLGRTRYTEDAYQSVLKSIKEREKRERFQHFLRRAIQEDVRLLEMDPHYEKAWRVRGDRSNDSLSFILEELCVEIGLCRPKKDGGVATTIPWSLFVPILLSSEGRPIDALKQSYSRIANLGPDDGDDKLYRLALEYQQEAADLVSLIMS